MTIREFFREVAAAQARAEDRAKEATFQAWQTARFYLQGRSKKGMPRLTEAMREIGGPAAAQQTPAQLLAVMQILSATYQIPLRRVTRG